jgi:hypothetical protein
MAHEFQPGDPACGPQGDCDILGRAVSVCPDDEDYYYVQYECVQRLVLGKHLKPYRTLDEIWGTILPGDPEDAVKRKPGLVDEIKNDGFVDLRGRQHAPWTRADEKRRISGNPDEPLPLPIYPNLFETGEVRDYHGRERTEQ